MNSPSEPELKSARQGLFGHEQIRLAELSVFNWGSFHGLHSASIDPGGTLVTGDNGAGKSTLIDGLMALLLPAGKATFNVAAAQGDRSDRTLVSYMRGSFGSAHDGSGTRVKSKREKAVVTGLRALYTSDDGSQITLASLFWTTQSTNALTDVKRVYIVAKRDLQLKEVLDAFGDGNARQLKQWLRDDSAITCCDENFSDYQELYRKLLYMDNKNAPALLARALGLKKIDDLTRLIRELVLEPSTVKDDTRQVVNEFSDLVAIHSQLIDTKEQVMHLQRLPAFADTIAQSKLAVDSLMKEKQGLSIYFGELYSVLWQVRVEQISASLEAISRDLQRGEIEAKDASTLVEQCHETYLKLGGDKIESIKKEVEHTTAKLKDVVRASSLYQQDCQQVDLDDRLTDAQVAGNQKVAIENLGRIDDEIEKSQNNFAEVAAVLAESQQEMTAVDAEIQQIEACPDSNIEVKYQLLRSEIVSSLQLPANELMFIGELVDVKDHEKHWQGAIERALGGLRITLMVPQKSYSMITRWLNVRHTGLHVRVQVVKPNVEPKSRPPFRENGFIKKLVWKEHPYREWLKNHLIKFDLQCVAGTDELDKTPFSMTQQGLMHMEQGRFQKKDQNLVGDKNRWCLGFSNQSRLALLQSDKRAAKAKLTELETQAVTARAACNDVTKSKTLWQRIESVEWDGINAPYWQERLQSSQADIRKFEQAGSGLEHAKVDWETAKNKQQAVQAQQNKLLVDKGSFDKDLENAELEIEKSKALAAPGLVAETRSFLQKRVGSLSLADTGRSREVESALDVELDKLRTRKSHAESSANGIMASFRGKDKWQPLTVDWPTGLEGLEDYLEHYAYLERDGLPKLVDQFKQRLNKHATQSLARIKTKLESEREEILERIDTINRVLRRTEFKPGSHLRLGSKREKYPHVQTFDRKLKSVLGQATSSDHEARFDLLAEVIEVLEKASAPGTASSLESLRLLDPRYQMAFYAEEVDSKTDEIRDVLESSSGKSGGEKESFAGTIVAASLAYVLTPEGFDRPVYSTVFLDEAFSNTAEAVSRRVLRVFKELHIHVNLITPYKNLNLARESARSLLIAERDSELHESRLCEVTWEEIDRRMISMKQASLKGDAESLGMELHG